MDISVEGYNIVKRSETEYIVPWSSSVKINGTSLMPFPYISYEIYKYVSGSWRKAEGKSFISSSPMGFTVSFKFPMLTTHKIVFSEGPIIIDQSKEIVMAAMAG